jgi:hypothetical protein
MLIVHIGDRNKTNRGRESLFLTHLGAVFIRLALEALGAWLWNIEKKKLENFGRQN